MRTVEPSFVDSQGDEIISCSVIRVEGSLDDSVVDDLDWSLC